MSSTIINISGMSSQITVPPNFTTSVSLHPDPVTLDSTNQITCSYLEARKSNDPKLIESTYQQCLDHFRGNTPAKQSEDQQNQVVCYSPPEKSPPIAVLNCLWDYFTKISMLELPLSTAQDALSLLMKTYTKILASIKDCVFEASRHIRTFIVDLSNIVLSKEGNALTKAVTIARYIYSHLRLFSDLVIVCGNVFYYKFWKLEFTKMYFRTIVLVEPICARLSNGIGQALVSLEGLRVRVMNHEMTQDVLWACRNILTSLLNLGPGILSLIPACVLDTIKELLRQFAIDVACQCFYNGLLSFLGWATGKVFPTQGHVVGAISLVTVQLIELIRRFFIPPPPPPPPPPTVKKNA